MAEYKNLESFAMAVSKGFKIRYVSTKNYDKIARKTAKEEEEKREEEREKPQNAKNRLNKSLRRN